MGPKLSILLIFTPILAQAQPPELIFHSGFEPNTIAVTNGVSSDLWGTDNSVNPPNDWVNDLEAHPNIGSFDIQYQGGDDTMRLAEIVADPTDPFNNVLEFWIEHANVDGIKGRVQANIYDNNNIGSLFYSIRLYLPSDFDTLKYISTEIRWLTLMEFWNNPPWVQDFGFRTTVDLQKIGTAPDSLRLGVHGQTFDTLSGLWSSVWDTTNLSFVVPIAQWMTIRINYIEGNASTGRFYLSVTPDGGSEVVVFDVSNYTQHPLDPAPDGLSHFNPFKLYTSADIIEGLANTGRLLHVYWDDLEIWKDLAVGIKPGNSTLGNYQIYPNPMRETALFTFDDPRSEARTLLIRDSQGRLVRTVSAIGLMGRMAIERMGLSSGLYQLELWSSDRLIVARKLVIE